MDYKLSDIIDVEKSRSLLESFCEAVGIASAIIDLEGNVLIGVRWQKICTDFHRTNKFTCKRCIESDTELSNELSRGKKFSLYRCKNGMTDAASPIIIEGKHIANAFVGQFLLHPPDIEEFRRQAAKYGFNEQDYLDALNEVAIIPEKKVAPIMDFLTSYAETLATMGLDKIRRKQFQKKLLHHRENLEEMVKERTAELRKLSEAVEQSPVTVMITDKNGTIEYVNPSFSEVTGYSAKEAIGQNPRILKSGNHPDSFYKDLWDTILSGKTWRGEILNRRKNDEKFWESTSISAIKNDQGEITHFVAAKQDITDRKQAEQAIMESQAKYRDLVENANCIIFQMDTRGNITFFNRFAQDFFGYSEAEIIGRSIVGTIVPETESTGRNLEIMIQDLVKYPERYKDNENENIGRNGELVWVAWTNRAIYDAENRLSEILCIGIDRTEQKKMEADLRRNLEELERFNKLAMGREIKMIQLKEEINELRGQLNQDKRYKIVR
jgi:two-component system sensor histidine kinase/response regulator